MKLVKTVGIALLCAFVVYQVKKNTTGIIDDE